MLRGPATNGSLTSLGVETNALYVFGYGDFRRIHRIGLIAWRYRAAQGDCSPTLATMVTDRSGIGRCTESRDRMW